MNVMIVKARQEGSVVSFEDDFVSNRGYAEAHLDDPTTANLHVHWSAAIDLSTDDQEIHGCYPISIPFRGRGRASPSIHNLWLLGPARTTCGRRRGCGCGAAIAVAGAVNEGGVARKHTLQASYDASGGSLVGERVRHEKFFAAR
jgi:hypothetical protein